MILLETNELYHNSMDYFRNNIMTELPNDDRIWREVYHEWLQKQGAVIVKSEKGTLANAVGVRPGFDKFGFEDECDATWFILRWS